MMYETNIIHYPKKKLFSLPLNNRDIAIIQYRINNGVYQLVHSEVPTHLRGQGIGKKLVQKTYEYLKENQLKANAICSYIRRIVGRNRPWQTVIHL